MNPETIKGYLFLAIFIVAIFVVIVKLISRK
jgi:hypothetical protein